MLITDPGYRLPKLSARSYSDTLPSGANKPGLLFARDEQTKQLLNCVVKFRGAERMSPEACARELLAAFIAKHLGICVVEPVLVDISNDFAELERGKSHYQTLTNSIGINYGSIYIPGCNTLPIYQPLTDAELPQAQKIVMLDLFIQNSDRRTDKPNLMLNGHELVIYDHELAFSFVMDLFKNPRPYELRNVDIQWINTLFLLPKIRRFPLPEQALIRAISQLDNNFWDRAFDLIPLEWQTDQLPSIRSFLTEIVNNIHLFMQSVKTKAQIV